jgi:hypothetical protein
LPRWPRPRGRRRVGKLGYHRARRCDVVGKHRNGFVGLEPAQHEPLDADQVRDEVADPAVIGMCRRVPLGVRQRAQQAVQIGEGAVERLCRQARLSRADGAAGRATGRGTGERVGTKPRQSPTIGGTVGALLVHTPATMAGWPMRVPGGCILTPGRSTCSSAPTRSGALRHPQLSRRLSPTAGDGVLRPLRPRGAAVCVGLAGLGHFTGHSVDRLPFPLRPAPDGNQSR